MAPTWSNRCSHSSVSCATSPKAKPMDWRMLSRSSLQGTGAACGGERVSGASTPRRGRQGGALAGRGRRGARAPELPRCARDALALHPEPKLRILAPVLRAASHGQAYREIKVCRSPMPGIPVPCGNSTCGGCRPVRPRRQLPSAWPPACPGPPSRPPLARCSARCAAGRRTAPLRAGPSGRWWWACTA